MTPQCFPSPVIPFASVEILTARLTDSAPPLVMVCAWCPDFDRTAPSNQGASHGICPSCLAAFDQAVA